jgi:hypothetical protein
MDGKVVAFERLLYSPKQYWPGRYFARHLLQANMDQVVIRAAPSRIVRIVPGSGSEEKVKAIWESKHFVHPIAMALGSNAVVVAGRLPPPHSTDARYALAAFSVEGGELLWNRPLPLMPDPWGLALDGAGRIVVALQDGSVLCLAAE